ncbi:hypothetical protein [Streptomyces sp. NPDC058268]|uniref:hypothetical protein n=1 Tax=Streptomyces sp. NPDC058268 TaxID=3346413 RepID=UPI0036E9B35E
MTYTPRRQAGELPFSSWQMTLRYRMEAPAVPIDFDDTLEEWFVDIVRLHDDEECPHCTPEQECAAAGSGMRLGYMTFVRLRDYTSTPAWEAADAHSGDLEKILALCTDPAYAMTPGLHWSEAFEKAIELPAGDLLIMDRVRLEPPWRGFGLGALAAAEAIRRLSSGCCAVACEPAPTDRDFADGDDQAFDHARAKIATVWESVGFRPFNNGIYLLDPTLRTMGDARAHWQQHFGH